MENLKSAEKSIDRKILRTLRKIQGMENSAENPAHWKIWKIWILYSCGKSAEKSIDWKICGEYGKSSGKSGLTGKSGM